MTIILLFLEPQKSKTHWSTYAHLFEKRQQLGLLSTPFMRSKSPPTTYLPKLDQVTQILRWPQFLTTWVSLTSTLQLARECWTYYHHQSLVPSMLRSATWIMFLHTDLFWANASDRLQFFRFIISTSIQVLFGLIYHLLFLPSSWGCFIYYRYGDFLCKSWTFI